MLIYKNFTGTMFPKKINAVIIDDEELGRKNLAFLIEKFCPEVQVLETFGDEIEAHNYLCNNKIDVIFLDINMPKMNGFEFLQLFVSRSFEVIFVTAYEDFGVQALRAKAIDYITKPISVIELQSAVKRVIDKIPVVVAKPSNLISISHNDGTSIVNQHDIVYLEADDYLTKIHLINNQKITVSKTIKYFEELLDNQLFFRIHKSYVVNITYIDTYSKQDGGFVKMKYAVTLPISRRKLTQFLDIISQNVKH